MTQEQIKKVTWRISITISLILLTLLLAIWYYVSNNYAPGEYHLSSQKLVEDYLQKDFLSKDKKNSPVFVKTGFYIQSLLFNSANNVTLTGYIWQTYPKNLPKNTETGFIFPEAINPMGVFQRVYYQSVDNNSITKTSFFNVMTRQDFEYKKYPFDSKVVWIHVQPQSFYQNIILIPDLAGYPNINENKIFGINKNIVLDGFTVRETYYSYHPSDYNANLGIKNFANQRHFPELYFNIVITRNLINAVVLHLLPLITILCLAFAVLLITTSEEIKLKSFNFTVSATLGTCSALFFSTMLMHSQLRSYLSTGYTVYLENLYYIVYLNIILVAVNAYIFSHPNSKRFKFIHFADNLFPKVIYWPLTLTLVLLETIHSLLLN